MANEGRDIRDLRRAVEANTKAIEALTKALVEIEKNRRAELQTKPAWCYKCIIGHHLPGEVYEEGCHCCADDHLPKERWVQA